MIKSTNEISLLCLREEYINKKYYVVIKDSSGQLLLYHGCDNEKEAIGISDAMDGFVITHQ